MDKIQKRKILAVFLAIVMLIPMLVVPASAADSGSFTSGWSSANFWDSAYSSMEMPGYGDEVLKALGTLTSSESCASSASGVHSGSAVSIDKPSGRSSKPYYVHCRCDSCDEGFTVTVTANELKAAYNSYVSNLPATGFNSAGNLILYSDIIQLIYARESSRSSSFIVGTSKQLNQSYIVYDYPGGYTVRLSQGSDSYYQPLKCFGLATKCSFTAPVSGMYRRLESPVATIVDDTHSFTAICSQGSSFTLTQGESYDCELSYQYSPDYSTSLSNSDPFVVSGIATCTYYPQVYEIQPTSSIGSTYDNNTRPSTLVSSYGYIDADGNAQVSTDTQLFNEVDGLVYNPVTGNSIIIDGWNYDYETRTYDGVTSDGMQWAVTYGDGDITLVEGDTTYNIYYLLEDTAEEDCQHEYTSTVTREATCNMSGVNTYTCSNCGDSYTKSIPATGHSWQVFQKVNTEYDETGNLVTQGYTIYHCSNCGEQYKSTDGAAPPSGGSENPDSPSTIGGLFEKLLSGVGDVLGGLIKGVLSLLTKAVDALVGIGELFAHFVENVVGLFGGFTDFLSAVFPFLPEEFFTIFSLGMILLVAAAVLRKFLN